MSYDFDEDQITLYVKGSNINEVGQFLSTTDNVYISFYPNNCNDFLYDNYDKSIIFGAINCNNFYQGYISSTSNNIINNIMSFDENNIISFTDIIPNNNNISLGNYSNQWKNIYLNSNIYLGNIKIYADDSSNIIIVGSLNSYNIYNSNTISTNNINATNVNIYSNISSFNTTTNNIFTSNIIQCDTLVSSNLTIYDTLITNNIINNFIDTIYINSSNITNNYDIDTNNIFSSNIIVNIINSSNIIIYDSATVNNLIVNDSSYLNGKINITNDFIPNSNNFYNLGSYNKKWQNIYISSNLYIGNTLITFIQSNIILNGDLYANNIIANKNINASNIIINNYIYSSGTLNTFNIISSNNIYTTNLTTSNQLNVTNLINANNITSKIINNDSLISSNATIYNNIISKNFITSNINTDYIFSSNAIIYNTFCLNNLIVSNITTLNGVILNNNIITTSNNYYNIGSPNYKFKNIYLGSNIFLGNSKIYSINSNIYIDADIYTNKLFTTYIVANNLYLNNIITNNGMIFTSNIINSNIIYTNSLISSNIISFGNISTNNLNVNNNIYSDSITTSNLNLYNTLNAENINISNFNSKNITSSNIFVNNIINTSYLNVSNILNLSGTAIISSDIIPIYDSIFNLGSSNMRWKDLYLSSGSLHIDNIIISSDNLYGGIKITDSTNKYQQITVSSVKLQSNNSSNFIIISVDNSGTLSFTNNDSNISSIGISYNDLIDVPFIYINSNTLFTSNNISFNQTLISSNNTLLYGNVGINTNYPKATLDINGTTISKSFQGSFIGDGYGISNIIASNIIGILSVSQGGSGCNILPYGRIIIGNNSNPIITSPNLIWSNITNSLIVDGNIISKNIYGNFIGDGSYISNINANNIIGTVSVANGGTGCNILPYGSLLIGNDKNAIIISSNLIWSNTINTLNIYGSINTNTIKCNNIISTQNIFIGNGSMMTNICASNIIGIIPVTCGGSGCNILPYGSILIGNNNNPVITSPNIVWSNTNNTLNIKGSIISSKIQGSFTGDGIGLSNIIASNIIGVISVSHGGTGCNIIPYGNVIIGNNNDPIINSPNLVWSNITNTLFVNGLVNANIIQGKFIGDGNGLSNIFSSNIIGILSVSQGGTGCNILQYGSLIIGNNQNPIITSPNFIWSNTTNTLNINGSLNANSIEGAFSGDGYNISNILSCNIIGVIPVSHGGTGCNILSYGNIIIGNDTNPIITSQNLIWSNINNTLNVNGSIYANNIQGSFIGDGYRLSNLNANNINGIISVSQGGTGCNNIPYGQILIGNNSNPIITTSNILWDFNNNSLNIIGNLNTDIISVNNYLYANNVKGSFIGDGSSLSNIIASNIIGTLSVSHGGTGCNILPYGQILIGNNNLPVITPTNLTWSNISNTLNINGSIFANNIQGIFIGDGSGLSNIFASNIKGVLSVSQGGTGCNILPYGSIIVGNNKDTIITSTNLTWSNTTNTLNINGSINANNIKGSFIGNGIGLSNIISSNIIGIFSVSQGGTGCNSIPYGSILIGNNNNPIITSTNLTWSNITNTLNVNGSIYTNNIQGAFSGDGSGLSNIVSSNIIGVLSVSQGGTGCNILPYGKIIIGNNSDPVITSTNLTWSNTTNTLCVNGSIYANNIQGTFIGDGSGLSNIISSNILGILSVAQGGTGCNILPYGNIIVGNNSDPIINSTNLTWSNITNTLNVNGSIYANNIQGAFIGDGSSLSNIVSSNIIGIISVSQGGSGCNILPYGNIIVGNNSDPIITSTNLIWSNLTNTLNVNGSIYSKNFQGAFIGDGSGLSNIISSNIIGILSISQGGTGCNLLPYGSVLVGNNTNPLNTSANIIWSNITNTLNVNGSIYANNIQGSFIGDGSGLSNINASNIINIVSIFNGGTGCNILPYGNILIGNNNNPIITNNKLIWSNLNSTLSINGNINAKNITGYFIGDGSGISNIISSNINGIFLVSQGGSGCNSLPFGTILIGNNSSPIITTSNLVWDTINNSLNINGSLISSNISVSNIYSSSIFANNIQGSFIGDGCGLSNIISSNIIGILSVSQGGTGCNILPYGSVLIGNNTNPIITTPNLSWSNNTNTLNVNGNIYSSKIYGNFIGNGSAISNIVCSNIIGILNIQQGGTGCNILPYGNILIGNNHNSLITSSDFVWSNIQKHLIINGDIYASNFQGNFFGSFYGLNLSSYYASNIIGTISLEQGGTGCNLIPYGNIIIGNYSNAIITTSNLYWDNIKNNLNINGNIYANTINGKIFASNIIGIIPVYNGGTGCNTLPTGQLIIGSSNSILTTPNLLWNSINNSLNVNGSVISCNIYSTFIGDGSGLSNVNISNITGIIPVYNGGTGCNYLSYGNLLIGNNYNPIISTSKLTWNDNSNILYVNGKIIADEIYGSFIGDGSRISNIVASNLIGILPVANGGIGTTYIKTGQILIGNDNNNIKSSSNFTWNNLENYLYINGDIYANSITADNIRNFISSNLTENIKVINGGTGCNILPYGQIIVGNNQDTIITTPNFIWSNVTNELFINGNVNAKNFQGSFIGDGLNISNFNINNIIGTINLANGGTGCNFIPYGQLLIGNDNNTIITTNNLIWSNIDKKLIINGDVFAKNIQGKFIGDGANISNLSATNISSGVLNVLQGGTGCNIIPFGQIIIGNNNNPIITSSNFTWNNLQKTLNINGSLYTQNIQGKFYGDGNNISNINSSNIIGIISVINGGTGCNYLPINNILIGNNNNPILTSSKLIWNNSLNSLNITGDINAKSVYINNKIYSSISQGKFYGDGVNISNIVASNIIGILSVENGGTGSNFFNLNEIILGNNNNPLITYSKLKWDNISNQLLINGDVIANNIQGKFYGDGTNISNFVASNLLGSIPILQGGTGCNIIPYGHILIGNNNNPIITTSNFYWDNNSNILTINGDIIVNNINVVNNIYTKKLPPGKFIGDGANISNFVASNIIGFISVINGGTGRSSLPATQILLGNDSNPITSTSLFTWDNNLNILTVENSTINSTSLISDSLYVSNITIFNSITANKSFNNTIISTTIQGNFYGDGTNISNFIGSNISGVVSLINGGTGCNNIPYGQLLIGNNSNSILTTSNLLWNSTSQKLYINGNVNANNINIIQNLYANNIQGKFYGDGSGLSNIIASNIIGPGILSVSNGGTGYSSLAQNQLLIGNGNNLLTTPNLKWDNITNTLTMNGIIYSTNINTTNTIFCTNINIANNLIANKSTHSSIFTKNIQGKFYGDGTNISNILSCNIIGIINVKNGGTGCNSLPFGNLLIGNNQNAIMTSSNLYWDNENSKLNVNGNIIANNIFINSNIYANHIYGMFNGDGANISNIIASNITGPGVLSVINGGTGRDYFPSGRILMGNDEDLIICYDQLLWDNSSYSLNINGYVNANNLNISNNIYSSNINIINNLTVNNSIHNTIIANTIRGKFIGDGTNISNINGSNIIGVVNVSHGGSGCNYLEYGQLLIGNNYDPIITTSNLIWNNISNKLYINGDINASNIFVTNNIYSKTIQGKFIGDGTNISNIGATNIVGIINVINGGIGTSSIISTRILYGNNNNSIGNSANFTWDNTLNSLNINGIIYTNVINSYLSIFSTNINNSSSIIANNGTFTSVYGTRIQGNFYGDGTNLSNLVCSNIIGVLPVINGGTGCNIIPLGQIIIGNNSNAVITTSNFIWDTLNNKLNINGNINANNIYLTQNLYANTIQGTFYGNGSGLSNIIASNIIGNNIISISNGGTGCNIIPFGQILIGNDSNPIYTTSNFTWNINSNILNINGSLITNDINTKIINVNYINISNSIIATNANINNLYANKIQGYFSGDGSGLSNIILNNLLGILSVSNGGLGCNILPYGQILIGNNNNPVITTSNLFWNNNNLLINGDLYTNNIFLNSNIYANNIQAKFYGDGTNISNIIASNIIGSGIIPVTNGGTGYSSLPINQILIGNNSSPLINSPNFTWDNSLNILNINGTVNTNSLNITNTLFASKINITNTLTANKATFNSSLYANNIQGSFIGDGNGLSNLLTSNLNGILSVSNGGTGCNLFIQGQILIGNGNNPIMTSSTIIWDQFNNNLIINGNINANNLYINQNIYANNIQGKFYGDGANISNIIASNIIGSSLISVSNGGTGVTTLPSTRILIGNDSNPIITSANLTWNANTLYLNGTLYTNNINATGTIFSTNANILASLTANKGNFSASLYSPIIQGSFYGDGTNISNIIASNIIGIINVANGGTGCNILPLGQLLIGNNSDPIITTSNLLWNDNTLNINGNIIASNISVQDILTLNYLETDNLNMIGWNPSKKIYNGIRYNNTPFYISLYLSANINIIPTIYPIPFSVNYNNNGGMLSSSSNIEPYFWKNNSFIAPVNGLYSINYSVCCINIGFYIWINKTNNFTDNYNNRFGIQNSYSLNGTSTSVVINSSINDNWYFIVYNGGNIYVNNDIYNTKASISLLQEIL